LQSAQDFRDSLNSVITERWYGRHHSNG
jgi:hypothetical protein